MSMPGIFPNNPEAAALVPTYEGMTAKHWVECKLRCVYKQLEDEEILDDVRLRVAALQLQYLMAIARVKGLIVEKKQVANATMDLGKVDTAALTEHLDSYLDSLAPGDRQEIETQAAALAERSAAIREVGAVTLPVSRETSVSDSTVRTRTGKRKV
jgi:hypothetical protein